MKNLAMLAAGVLLITGCTVKIDDAQMKEIILRLDTLESQHTAELNELDDLATAVSSIETDVQNIDCSAE